MSYVQQILKLLSRPPGCQVPYRPTFRIGLATVQLPHGVLSPHILQSPKRARNGESRFSETEIQDRMPLRSFPGNCVLPIG